MEPFQWTILGLCIDIAGAFFVSVEAIKLENLRKLRSALKSSPHMENVMLGTVIVTLSLVGWLILDRLSDPGGAAILVGGPCFSVFASS